MEAFIMRGKNIIMNFTHAYEEESFLCSSYFQWIDCTHLHGVDCYCDSDGVKQLNKIIEDFSPEGIHWIDSGNYHYLTKFWTDKIKEPFSLIVFDHHPDMQPPLFDNLLSCGCWVRTMLDTNPWLRNVCLIGASEKLKSETKGYGKRLLFYSEQTLRHVDSWRLFSGFYLNEPVYISVDKDVLSPDYATTNWDQGSLTLFELKRLLSIILQNERVIGVDICGEAPVVMNSFINKLTAEKKNGRTNEELFALLAET